MKALIILLLSFAFHLSRAQVSNTLFSVQDTLVCEGDSTLVYSLSGDNLNWYIRQTDTVLSSKIWLHLDSSAKVYARTKIPNSYGDNLLINGNFASGDTGFVSELLYRTQPCQINSYKICKSTTEENPCSQGSIDGNAKDINLSDSLMMYITLAKHNNIIWKQTVPVQPGQYYSFAFWVLKFSVLQTAIGQVSINGNRISPVISIANVSNWKRYAYTWYSRIHDSATISIENIPSCGFGWPTNCDNAFAFDDLSFRMLVDSVTHQPMAYDSMSVHVIKKPFDSDNIWLDDSLLCQKDTITLNLSQTMHSIRWENGSDSVQRYINQTGTYSFSALNKDRCPIEDSIFIVFNELPQPIIKRQGSYIYTSTPAFRYEWMIDEQLIPFSDTTWIHLSSVGKYTLFIFDQFGCSKQADTLVSQMVSAPQINYSINLYPNPVADFLILNTDLTDFEFSISDLSGRKVLFGQNEKVLDCSSLSTGVYLLAVTSRNQDRFIYKILKL